MCCCNFKFTTDARREADFSAVPKGKKPTPQQIGGKIQLAMMEGKTPDDSLILSLVTNALKEVEKTKSGWIMVDFPRNKAQALLLEKELTG